MTIHTELVGRWSALTLAEQLAHVGSEVERTIAAWEAKRTDRFERALERALELFEFTVRDERWRGHRRREILRTREEFLTLLLRRCSLAGVGGGAPEGFRQVRGACATRTRGR